MCKMAASIPAARITSSGDGTSIVRVQALNIWKPINRSQWCTWKSTRTDQPPALVNMRSSSIQKKKRNPWLDTVCLINWSSEINLVDGSDTERCLEKRSHNISETRKNSPLRLLWKPFVPIVVNNEDNSNTELDFRLCYTAPCELCPFQ